MVPAFGIVFWILRCGKIIDSLIKTSSLICTSCATTETPSIRTQWPTTHCQPIIALRMKACALISVWLSTVELEIRQPPPILQLAPITTFGPITAFSWTYADGSITTLPMMLAP